MKKIVKTKDAPEAIGPYSQGVIVENLLFTSGQIAICPESNTLIEGDIRVQTRQVLENLKGVIHAAGSDLSSVIKVTVYLTNKKDFKLMNEVYSEYFTSEPPARTTVFVQSLPKDVLVEIDTIVKV